ncbi:hypothetical protein KC349_g31 [Hortaea werneckii]|nr:hypothetical protein KC349_g31 [Hortaea werneckii]
MKSILPLLTLAESTAFPISLLIAAVTSVHLFALPIWIRRPPSLQNPFKKFFFVDFHISWGNFREQWGQYGTIMHHFAEENVSIALVRKAFFWVFELQVLPLGAFQGPQNIAERIEEAFGVRVYCYCATIIPLPVCH